jgi:cobalt-zinc-cadmium efflux system membrane fusion protein
MKAFVITILMLNICLGACKNQPGNPVADTRQPENKPVSDLVQFSPEQLKNSGVITGTPETRGMHSSLKVNGIIDLPPDNIVSISIPLGGYVKRTALIEGTKVRKGEVLATIEDQVYIQLQQDYLTGKIRLEFLEADYTRQQTLNETKSTSDKVLQQTKSEYLSQKVLVRSLYEKLRLVGINPRLLNESNISRSISIHAPISGYVSKINVNNGKYVTPSDVLFELINPDDVHLRLTVFENDAENLRVGQQIRYSTNNRPEEQYTASIHLITPNIGENRSTEVHCHLEKHGQKLLPGTFVNAFIELNNKQVTAVPEEAVVKWENHDYLFVQETESSFRLTSVETGSSNDGYTEIRSALPAKSIVTKNAYTILMKMKNSTEAL